MDNKNLPQHEQSAVRQSSQIAAINIRKKDRQQLFSKRRNILDGTSNKNEKGNQSNLKTDKMHIVDERYREQLQLYLKMTFQIKQFPDLINHLAEADPLKQHYGMIGIRKILSVVENPPIQTVIDAGLVPRMIEYVQQTEFPQLQLEATWALTNVASGTNHQCQSIIDKGGIPLFVNLLLSNNMGIVQQAIWALGNISSDCTFYRDNIVRAGGLANLIKIIGQIQDNNLLKHTCWAISNMCRGNPLPKFQAIRHAIPILAGVLASGRLTEKEVIADCCWAISYHCDSSGNKSKIESVVQSGVIPFILKQLQPNPISLLVPCIRILGNISTGTEQHTNELLQYSVLDKLDILLDHSKKVVRRETCWVISNIAAGTRLQVNQIFQRQNLLRKLLNIFETDATDVRRELCYLFSNFSNGGQPLDVFKFYKNCNIIRLFMNVFTLEDNKTIEIALECFFIVLAHGEKFKGQNKKNPLVLDVINGGNSDILEKLQYHKSDIVYENVSKILVTFFEMEDPLAL